MEIINELSNKVIGCAIEVHKGLGPGLLESAYQECLFYKLNKSGYFTEKQKALPLIFEDVKMDVGYRIDLMVEGILIIEIKAVDKISDIHISQLATYLKLSKCKLGLLLNFNVILLKDGIKRVIN